MPFRRPKVVFDTQVISNVCTGAIPRSEWDEVLKYISRRCRYAISAITLYELLAGIANGDVAHFAENQHRIRVLCEPLKREFLPLVGDFVRFRVFRLAPRKLAFQPHKLKLWADVVLTAKTREELVRGRVTLSRPGHAGKSYGFDLPLLAKQIENGKQNHSERLEALRQGKLLASTPDTWTQAVLREIGVPVNPANATRLLGALDAAHEHDLYLYSMARNHTYDFAEHDSDWLDGQQLYYLADPLLKFITCDTKIRIRTRSSSQRDRILSFEDLKSLTHTTGQEVTVPN